MKKTARELLKKELGYCNIKLTEEKVNSLLLYLQFLQQENKTINLTSITNTEDIIRKHFIDSLLFGRCLNWKYIKKLIDVGTGAGFPGIPLKILNPDIDITLVEAKRKKVEFLKRLVIKLNLKQVKIVNERVEKLGKLKLFRFEYDAAVARALAILPVLCEYCLPLVHVGGVVIAGKGPQMSEGELEQGRKAALELGGRLHSIENLLLPGNVGKRKLIVIKKVKPTPKQYPRKIGKPSKFPLK